MALFVSNTVSSTDNFTFLTTVPSHPERWQELIHASPTTPVVIRLKGEKSGLTCLVLNVHSNNGALYRLANTLSENRDSLCTDLIIVLMPPTIYFDNKTHREYYQALLTWQPDFLIDVNTACCPAPLAFAYRHQAGSVVLGNLFSPYTVNGCFSAAALTRYAWPCPSIELLVPHDASKDVVQELCQTLSELRVNTDKRQAGHWLRSVYRLDALKAASVVFSERPVFGVNISLNLPVVNNAFVTLHPGESLGWLDHNGVDHLRLKGVSAAGSLQDYFDASDNRLRVRMPLTCFLIAHSVECLHDQGIMHFSPDHGRQE
ncbi:hypothetical protein [Alteromonas sp. H39]|uniref:hypothetical protein n=1 Tax=Alteromonas sp. H39 TaxID=3389876 RepID=UPI0039DFBBD2